MRANFPAENVGDDTTSTAKPWAMRIHRNAARKLATLVARGIAAKFGFWKLLTFRLTTNVCHVFSFCLPSGLRIADQHLSTPAIQVIPNLSQHADAAEISLSLQNPTFSAEDSKVSVYYTNESPKMASFNRTFGTVERKAFLSALLEDSVSGVKRSWNTEYAPYTARTEDMPRKPLDAVV